jgi:hypothetical protein
MRKHLLFYWQLLVLLMQFFTVFLFIISYLIQLDLVSLFNLSFINYCVCD